jgi:NAD(P)H dehydrogenase (quinone)
VTGASGKTGRALTAALEAAGHQVTPLVRPGVDLDTGAGLEAMRGCDALYLLAPNVHPDEPALVARCLDAARSGGVRRVVYHSVAQPYAPAMRHHVDKAVSEDLVRRSGLAWTVLQPCAYTQNLVPSLTGPDPVLAVPYSPDALFSFVDLQDVADAAVSVLSGDAHTGATYELGGPAALSVREVAALASQVRGAEVRVARTTPQQWASGPGASMTDDARARLLAMFAFYDTHGLLAGSLVLAALLGRRPTTVRAVLERELLR